MREEWKPVRNYEGLYEVSDMGRVKSLERTVWNSVRGFYRTVPERILKPIRDKYGYVVVNLHKDAKSKTYKIHRLVATAFCENPEGYTEVNHINEDKADCRAENLEWCSRSYNNTYNGRAKKAGKKVGKKLRGRKQAEETIKKRAEKLSKPVIGINKVSGLIVEFQSAREAERQLGINQGHICSCLIGRLKSAGGYVWYYAD